MLSALYFEAFNELGLDQALWPFVIIKKVCGWQCENGSAEKKMRENEAA